MTTNWATFYKDIEFPSPCTVQHHTPLIELSKGRFPNILVIYRQRKDKLAMLLVTQSAGMQESMRAGEAGPVLAGSVMEMNTTAY